jgi:MFS family permease
MKKQRYQESFKAFCRIRNTEVQAARDLYYAHCQIREENQAIAGTSLFKRMWELVAVPRLRRASMASAWIVISQQFSGINIMAFYSSTIFANAGYSTLSSLLASLGFGLVMFVFAFPAVWVMDTFGRRNLLLSTFPSMAICLLAAGLCFLMDVGNSARVPLIAFFIYLFTALYGPGMGPLPSIYFSESFPLSHREIGAAFTICVNNAVGSALSLTFPSLLDKLGPTGAFGFYAGLNMLAFVVIFFIVPETKYVLHQLRIRELSLIIPTGSALSRNSIISSASRPAATSRIRFASGCLGGSNTTSSSSAMPSCSHSTRWMESQMRTLRSSWSAEAVSERISIQLASISSDLSALVQIDLIPAPIPWCIDGCMVPL